MSHRQVSARGVFVTTGPSKNAHDCSLDDVCNEAGMLLAMAINFDNALDDSL